MDVSDASEVTSERATSSSTPGSAGPVTPRVIAITRVPVLGDRVLTHSLGVLVLLVEHHGRAIRPFPSKKTLQAILLRWGMNLVYKKQKINESPYPHLLRETHVPRGVLSTDHLPHCTKGSPWYSG